MLPLPAGREASPDSGAARYERHRPERTLLYQLVQEYYPAFKAHLAAQGTAVPGYVEQEFEDYLKCGRLEHGFLRVRCDACHAEHLVALSCKKRGFSPSCGARRMADECMDALGRAMQEQLPRAPRCWWTRCFRTARASVGVECPVSVAFPVREPPCRHGPSARHHLPLTHLLSSEFFRGINHPHLFTTRAKWRGFPSRAASIQIVAE